MEANDSDSLLRSLALPLALVLLFAAGAGCKKKTLSDSKSTAPMSPIKSLGYTGPPPEPAPAPAAGCTAPAAPAPSVPPAHGGSAIVNGQAADAMFFESEGVNPFIDTDEDHLSTFGLDVDTASFTMARAYLDGGNVPPREAVRVEEFVNFFRYDYPASGSEDFAIHLDGGPSPFGSAGQRLLRVGIRAREVEAEDRKDASLVFVVDTSGSMEREDRLGLVKRSLRLLVDQLGRHDRVGIVEYGSSARVVLEPTGLEDRDKILDRIESLRSSGATNAEQGLLMGYQMLSEARIRSGINRVILCSDGVANVGTTGADGILKKIEEFSDGGITLSAVGFGMGNYNDVLMEKLADKGDGNYAYVDDIEEARRVFVENLTGTLQVVARDAKVQVDFNPAVVARYRLLGYENRDIADRDFRNNAVDAGEIGAGHQVTALYEIKMQKDPGSGPLATVTLRYKDAEREGTVREQEESIKARQFAEEVDGTSPDFRLAAATAQFAEILRHSFWAKEEKLSAVTAMLEDLPRSLRGRDDVAGLREMVKKADRVEPDRQAEE